MRQPTSALVTVVVLLSGCAGAGAGDGDGDPVPPAGGTTDNGETGDTVSGTFEVGGRDLALSCSGTAGPTIVLESGDGVPSDVMGAALSPGLSDEHRVCSYDRAGTGSSDAAEARPRTAGELLGDLHGLLEEAAVPGPYVLVGHSAGGLLVQAYARTFSEDVVGVVALNPVPPWRQWRADAFASMTRAERDAEAAYYDGDGSAEGLDFRGISARATGAPAPEVPFHLLVSTIRQCESRHDICGRTYPAYLDTMRATAEAWPGARMSVVATGHEIYLDRPSTVMDAVTDVLARAG